jgi:Holliday junction resolvasome RuvABC endonuclease subunit
MRFYGIDYSMTSPAVCLFNGEEWYARFLTQTEKHLTHRVYESKLGAFEVHGDPYPPYTTQEQRFNGIADWVMDLLDDVSAKVVIEDYAMGARGRVFHIAENCGLLKHKIWKSGMKFDTLAPTALKKFATGKGNSDKNVMHSRFVEDTGIDLMKEMTPNAKDCGNPVSDIVDAFYLARWSLTTHNLRAK